jgi:ligand-binding sensor domain-containing protein
LDFVFRYNDVWGDWTTTTLIGPDNIGTVRDIAVDQGSRVYVAASDGLRRWEEGAETTHFTNLPTDYIRAVAVDRSVNPNVVYIGTSGMGVYVSENDGATWTAMNDGLGSFYITSLQVNEGQPKVLYAGTTNGGVWSMTIGNGQSISNPLYLPLVVNK